MKWFDKLTGKDCSIDTVTASVSKETPGSSAAAVHYRPENRFSQPGKVIFKAGGHFQRISYGLPDRNLEILADDFGNNDVCEFSRLAVKGEKYFLLNLPGEYDVLMNRGSGLIFRRRRNDGPHYWLPLQPMARTYDKFGRIVTEEALPKIKIDVLSNESSALFRVPEHCDLIEFVMWTLHPDSCLIEELHLLSPAEQQGIFLWGSHTQCTGPKDLYHNLIHGAVYKKGSRWPPRQCTSSYCETDAYALYAAFHGMWKITGKKIYQHMKIQLVCSVAARQENDGGWRHGSLTDEFEMDYRHCCSGIHLLAAYYEETRDAAIGSSLKKAVDYLSKQCDKLSAGNWYLHDSLELSVENMRKSPVTYQYSRALGKSPSNMLVLNTHLDALVAFSRYQEVSGLPYMADEIASGVNAAVAVLGLAPAETFYRILFRAIELTFLPDSTAGTLSLPVRAVRRLARQRLIPLLPRIKKIFPRIVMPNGYIDRNLSLNEFWYPYFLINIMDLLRFRMRFRIQELDPIINNAVKFVRRVGLEKWLNDERTAYAVGFWAEALYLYCLQGPDRNRADLAKAAISLYGTKQGIPPCFLGCNPEYIRLDDQVPCLQTDNDLLRVINLSIDPGHREFLLVNGTDSPQDTSFPRSDGGGLAALDHNGKDIFPGQTLTVPARGWVRLVSSPLLQNE